LDQNVPERAETRRCGAEHLAGETTIACTGLDDKEGVGLVEGAPQPVERACRTCTEERADLRTGDEVATRAPGAVARGEETALSVEGDLHEPVEGDRAFPTDQLRELRDDGAHVDTAGSSTARALASER